MSLFKPNPRFIEQLEKQRPVKAALLDAAQHDERVAIGRAPRGASDDYVHSIKATEAGGEVILGTNDFAGHMVEWGSVNQPPAAVIRGAARSGGKRLEETH